MHRRAAAFGVAFALTAGSGVAAAGVGRSTGPAVVPAMSADTRATPVRLQRSDLTSRAAFSRAYDRMLAARASTPSQTGEGLLLYGWGAEAVPVHDVDGDHADDVLEVRGSAFNGASVALRSGRTGREKWNVRGGPLSAVQYVPVPGGHPLVLTYALSEEGEDAFLAFAGTATLTVRAIDATTGAQAWSSDWTGALTFTPAGAVLTGLAFPGGVLTSRPGSHPTLLVDSFDEVYTDVSDTIRSHVAYVDLVTGKATGVTKDVEGNASFDPVDDLDADGSDDVVTVTSDGAVNAMSGRDGHALWAVTTGQPAAYGWADSSADLTGDRRPDVFVGMGSEEAPGVIAALDGRTGRQLWRHVADGARSVGDVDHDGRSDTRLVAYPGQAVRYTTVNGTGRTLWSTTVTSPIARTNLLSWLAGDLDADGIPDSYVRLVDRSAPAASTGKGSFVVNGRTGRLAQHPDWGIPLGASLDGRGGDFARTTTVLTNGAQRVMLTAVDGRSGHALWRRQVSVDSSSALVDVWGGNFGGTGRVDLLGLYTASDRTVVAVQQGRTGATGWSGGYDTRGEFKPL